MEQLKKYRYVAVPIINVDVREGLINNDATYRMPNKTLWKSLANGTDGNRNMQ